MTRRHALAGMVLALSLAGCGSSSDDETDTCATPPADETVAEFLERCDPGAAIPEPDEAQADALVDELAAILPALADEPGETVEKARNTCASILDDGANLEEAAKVRFTGDGVDEVSDDQAAELVEVVRAQEWCSP